MLPAASSIVPYQVVVVFWPTVSCWLKAPLPSVVVVATGEPEQSLVV